jgi:hypothetical protein
MPTTFSFVTSSAAIALVEIPATLAMIDACTHNDNALFLKIFICLLPGLLLLFIMF